MTPPFDPRQYAGRVAILLGASGFIGRWVARGLGAAGAEVHLLVRDARSAEAVFSEYGVLGTLRETDLADGEGLDSLCAELRPDIAFNLVGYGVDPGERRDGDEARAKLLNAELPVRLAEAMQRAPERGWRGRRVVHVGSVYEYGNIGGHLEEVVTPAPFGLYGRSKLAGTLALARTCQRHGLAGLTARICQIYGPGEHPGRLLPQLVDARNGREPLSLSIGTQQKDFTYVGDVAEGLLRLGASSGNPGEVVNLATGRLTSVREFAQRAAHLLQLDPDRLRFEKPISDNELRHLEVATGRLRALTDWVPATDVDAGIRSTLQFLDRARTR